MKLQWHGTGDTDLSIIDTDQNGIGIFIKGIALCKHVYPRTNSIVRMMYTCSLSFVELECNHDGRPSANTVV